MIVVADTSPVNYLILIEEIHILPKMYGSVVIPGTVRDELLHPSTPLKVTDWISRPPAWLEVRVPANVQDTTMAELDPGERDAILLAEELRADQLIVDDREARREAARRGIPVMGTLGVLAEAASRGLLNLPTALRHLQATNFYIAPEVLARLLKDQR